MTYAAALHGQSSDTACRPFLKWVGGKRQLLPAIVKHVPDRFGTYYEPFVGGGALFFHLRPRRAVLADTNARLVRAYAGVRDSVDEVIRLLREYPHDVDFFHAMRQRQIDAESDAQVAAWLIYLNRTGYNGLYRVNAENRFNVPFGRYSNPTICDEETLRDCSQALQRAEVRVADFAEAVASARSGDFIYFDPPYAPLSATSSFTSYTANGFGPSEQQRLRDVALDLKGHDVRVLLSNSSAPVIRQLYANSFDVFEVAATRMVNSKADRRGAVTELLIR